MENRIKIFAPSLVRDFGLSCLDEDQIGQERNQPIESLEKWRSRILQLSLYGDEIYLPAPWSDGSTPSSIELAYNPFKHTVFVHDHLLRFEKVYRSRLNKIEDDLSPLVEEGIIKFYNPLQIFYDKILDNLPDEELMLEHAEVKEKQLFVQEALHYCRVLEVPYTALRKFEIEEIDRAARSLRRMGLIDQRVINGLISIELPRFAYSSGKLIAGRRKQDEFEAFRKLLREVFATGPDVLQTKASMDDYRHLLKERFSPKIDEIRRSRRLMQSSVVNAKANSIAFSAGVFSAYVLSQNIETALAGGAITSATSALLQALSDASEKPKYTKFVQEMFF